MVRLISSHFYFLHLNFIEIGLSFYHTTSNASKLAPYAIECIFHSWDLLASLSLTIFAPIVFAGILLGRILFNKKGNDIQTDAIARLAIYWIDFQYFNIAALVFGVFACTKDTFDNKHYLNLYQPGNLFFRSY